MGSLEHICSMGGAGIATFAADCLDGAVECSCCSTCCSELSLLPMDQECEAGLYSVPHLDLSYSTDFQRTGYSFV